MLKATPDEMRRSVIDLTSAPDEQTDRAIPDSVIRRRVAAWARSSWCVVIVGLWAFWETIAWPIVPEVLLVTLVMAAPRLWWRHTAVAVVAATLGALAMLNLTAAGVRPPQPLVTDQMRQHAERAVAADGAEAIWSQPFSGVPFKAYAAAAGDQRVEVGPYVVTSALARGTRFVLIVAAAALVAAALTRWRRFYPAALVMLLSGFTVGLVRVVTSA